MSPSITAGSSGSGTDSRGKIGGDDSSFKPTFVSSSVSVGS